MESVFVCEEGGAKAEQRPFPATGNIRHVIQSITPGGPTSENDVLLVDDEILEVNGIALVGVSHDKATQLVQSTTSKDVTVVVCRPINEEEAKGTCVYF